MNRVVVHLWHKDLYSLWEFSSESSYLLLDLSTTGLLVIVLPNIKPDFVEDVMESNFANDIDDIFCLLCA